MCFPFERRPLSEGEASGCAALPNRSRERRSRFSFQSRAHDAKRPVASMQRATRLREGGFGLDAKRERTVKKGRVPQCPGQDRWVRGAFRLNVERDAMVSRVNDGLAASVYRGVALPVFFLACLVVACGTGSAHSPVVRDAGTDAAEEAAPSAPNDGQAGGLDGPAEGDSPLSVGVACNDSTGANDCCPVGATDGSPCDGTVPDCWTRCTPGILYPIDSGRGVRHQMSCEAGHWISGHGWFECDQVDAGS